MNAADWLEAMRRVVSAPTPSEVLREELPRIGSFG
jgi:hypothetical protein